MYYYNATTVPRVDGTWLIVSAVLAIVGGIAGYFLFTAKKNNGEYTGFMAWLHEFLNFKKYFINIILKVMYMITAIFITLSSFSVIGTSVASFFLYLILGNVIARICYEFLLMLITIVDNTSEINAKLGGKKDIEKPVTKAKKTEEKTEEK